LSSTASDPALEISARSDTSNLDFKFTDTDGSVVVDQVHHKSEYYATDGAQVSAKVRTEYADVSGGMNYVISTSGAGVAVRDRIKVGSGGDISFYEDTGTTAKFFWDASAESLGIGTTTLDANIAEGIDINGFVVSRYDFASGVPSAGLGGVFSVDANVTGFSSGDLVLQCRPGVNSRSIIFYTGNTSTERLRIDASGNVGIGTVSPSAKLDTAYTDSATYSSTSPSADLILSRKNTGNTANETVGIRFDVTGWSGSTTGGAAIEAIQPSNASTADLAFLTRDAGTWGERMRITSDGNLLVGKAASDVSVNGFEADNNGYTKITRTSGTANVNTVLQLNRLSTDGDILRLHVFKKMAQQSVVLVAIRGAICK
jgi:hypothetical protein